MRRKVKLSEFAGIWSKEKADNFEKNIEITRKAREITDKERRERMKRHFK